LSLVARPSCAGTADDFRAHARSLTRQCDAPGCSANDSPLLWLSRQLLVKMQHGEVASAPRQAQDLLGRRPTACRSADRANPAPPHRAPGRASAGTSAPTARALRQLAPLMPLEQPLETHLPTPCSASARPIPRPFRAVLKPDRSRATKIGRITSHPHEDRKRLECAAVPSRLASLGGQVPRYKSGNTRLKHPRGARGMLPPDKGPIMSTAIRQVS
jgi:hypothetical protein